MSASAELPLAGVRIIELGQLIAVPSAGQQLLEMGAEVVKVEPPGGEPARQLDSSYGQAIFRGFNRGKTAIELDIKSEEGAERLRRLIAGADAVIHNLRPGTLDRLGFSYAAMQELRPDLISVSVSGFGPRGPSALRPGLDIAAQAESGMMSVTGEADGQPQRVGAPVIDHTTAFIVVQTVLAALLRRDRFGHGTEARIPLLEVAVSMQTSNWVEQQITGSEMRRRGNGQPTLAPAADVLTAADGEFVVSGYQPQAWRILCTHIGQPELADDPRFRDNASRVANRPVLIPLLNRFFSRMTVAEAVGGLTAAGVVAAELRGYGDVPEAADIVDNGVFAEAVFEDQRFRVPTAPCHSSPPLSVHAREVSPLRPAGEFSPLRPAEGAGRWNR
ncbi:CaiB/BaiF CoA transferase family protein [Brevibacterium album]|uniref:CaiB/BaiF CoA transferase family protein n=1 Tax=Brevibacterium album TaxID=417948 RepID=UPI0004224810|nr:CoA transferase [Brevibacterium album]